MIDISIWMPITWNDWMKDTSMLSLQEQGAYFMIVKEYWNNQGAISDDKTRIYRSCGAQTRSEKESINFILKTYFLHQNCTYIHNRIDEEIAKAKANKASQAERTKAATAARKAKSNNVTTDVTFTPSPSPSPVIDDDDSARAGLFAETSIEIQKLMCGRILNTQAVHAWIKAGADKNLIIETLKVCLSKKGGEPPNSLKYFESAIIEAIRQKNEIIEVKNGTKQNIRQNGITKYGKRSITDITTELFAEIDAGTF